MGTLEKKLNWNEAKQYSNVGVDFLIVPLNFNLKPFGENYELARFIVFYKSKTSGITMEIVELLSKKGESFKGKQAEIIAASVYNKLAQKNENISGVNADVFFYNDQYRRVGSYEIKNGGIQKTKNRLKISDKLENNSVTNLLTTNSSNCQFWYVVVDWYDSEGNFVYRDILYSFETGDCSGEGNNGNPNEEPGEPAGGGETLEIQNNVTDPCIYSSVNYAIYSGATNKISNFINNVFGNSDIYILHFFSNALVGSSANNDANTGTGLLFFGNQIVTKTVITFNTNQLTGASQEYIGATILHEAVHAWIDHKFPVPIENAQQHNLMAANDRFTLMYNALLEMFPALNPQDAYDLTWGGLFNSIAFNNLPSIVKDRIIQTNNNYKFRINNTGTPC